VGKGGQGGEMTQTMYADVNKRTKKNLTIKIFIKGIIQLRIFIHECLNF
jgi:hypothetical protein